MASQNLGQIHCTKFDRYQSHSKDPTTCGFMVIQLDKHDKLISSSPNTTKQTHIS